MVDDGSDDGTAAAARAAGADVVIEINPNRGKGEALRRGMRAASGEVVAFTDADLAYAPAQLLRLLEAVEQGAPVVVGNRNHPDSVTVCDPSRLRRCGSWGVWAVRAVLGLGRTYDTQCGLKAFARPALDAVLEPSVMDRFSFDIEVLFIADRLGLRVQQLPVEVVNSDLSSVRVLSDGVKLMRDMVRIRLRAMAGRYPVRSEGFRPAGGDLADG